MKLSNYGEFPANLPVIAEDELFLYPFMISPLFLSDEDNKRKVEELQFVISILQKYFLASINSLQEEITSAIAEVYSPKVD